MFEEVAWLVPRPWVTEADSHVTLRDVTSWAWFVKEKGLLVRSWSNLFHDMIYDAMERIRRTVITAESFSLHYRERIARHGFLVLFGSHVTFQSLLYSLQFALLLSALSPL